MSADESRSRAAKPLKYEAAPGTKIRLDINPTGRAGIRLRRPPILLTEGSKKVDAVYSAALKEGIEICVIGVNGVHGGLSKTAKVDWKKRVRMKGRTIIIAFDSDINTNEQVALAAKLYAAFFRRLGAVGIKFINLDPAPDGSKQGIDDALAAGATLKGLIASADDACPDGDERPMVDVTRTDKSVTDQIISLLCKRGDLFRTAVGLVRLDVQQGTIQRVTEKELQPLCGHTMNPYRVTKSGSEPCMMPWEHVVNVANDQDAAFPRLNALVPAPNYTRDGELIIEPGYHAPSGNYILRSSVPLHKVHDKPPASHLNTAHQLIGELLYDFPFATIGDRTAAVALALGPLVRNMIAGPTPLFDISAPIPGSGKSLLAHCLLSITQGRVPSLGLPFDHEEHRKLFFTTLLQKCNVIFIDNVTGVLYSPILAKLLTDSSHTDRLLGVSKNVTLLIWVTWVLTSNNLAYSDEIARRIVPVRLEPLTDRPEARTGFRHSSLTSWVTEHRADLLWALCTFVEHWKAQGCPAPTRTPVLGSYEEWHRVTAGILEAAGFEGFLAERTKMATGADPVSEALGAFAHAWWAEYEDKPVNAGALMPLAQQCEVPLHGVTFDNQVVSLAKTLMRHKGRFFGALQIIKCEQPRKYQLRKRAESGQDSASFNGSNGFSGRSHPPMWEKDSEIKKEIPMGNGSDPKDPSDPLNGAPARSGSLASPTAFVPRVPVAHGAPPRASIHHRHEGFDDMGDTSDPLASASNPLSDAPDPEW